MWLRDGRKLTGDYGIWNGREVELNGLFPINGLHQLIQDGGPPPGPEWTTTRHSNRFARTTTRHHLDVEPATVSDVHSIDAHAHLGTSAVHVRVIAEDLRGRLAIESTTDVPPTFLDRIAEEYELTLDGPTVHGWAIPADLTPITITRTN